MRTNLGQVSIKMQTRFNNSVAEDCSKVGRRGFWFKIEKISYVMSILSIRNRHSTNIFWMQTKRSEFEK